MQLQPQLFLVLIIYHLPMAICNFLLYCVVLFFSRYSKKPYVYGAREVANHHHVVQMRSLVPASTCSASNKGAKGIQVYDRNGPCSPHGQENSSPNSHQMFLQDQSRVDFSNSKSSNKDSVDNNGEGPKLPISNTSIGGYSFGVTVGFGTPKQDLTLILDTGSDYTWIKCKPCSECQNQDKIYDPKASPTASVFPCSAGSCNYSANYMDKTYSNGYYVQDTLTLSSSDVYPNFVFGCNKHSSGFDNASGLLGLGRDSAPGHHTFLSQITKKNSKLFCYCLPAKENTMGYLLFGDEALETCQTNKFTPLLKGPDYYFVNLTGITFGGQRLNISSYVSSSSGTVLDSGTVITHLPGSVYSKISSAFQKSMSKYPTAQPFQVLDTCYNLQGQIEVAIPKMVLHFANADVELDQSAVIWRESDARVCLAFARKHVESDLTIIGSHQQRGLNILYDIQQERVQFGDGNCSN